MLNRFVLFREMAAKREREEHREDHMVEPIARTVETDYEVRRCGKYVSLCHGVDHFMRADNALMVHPV